MNRKNFRVQCLSLFVLSLMTVFVGTAGASYTKSEKAIERINAEDAHKLVSSGQALLVCSYDDDKCKSKLFEGALLKSELEARVKSLPKDQKIIFYCEWPNEATSASLAAKYRAKGYTNVTALKGGINAWKAKGYPMKK